jgi:hypothetical protein
LINYKHILLLIAAITWSRLSLFAQSLPDSIDAATIEKTIRILASDSLKGRGNKSPVDLLKAATFIGDRFKQAGLLPFPGSHSHYVPFQPWGIKNNTAVAALQWNGLEIAPSHFIYINPQPGVYPSRELSHFKVEKLDAPLTAATLLQSNNEDTPLLLWSDRLQEDGKSFFPESFDMPLQGIKREILIVQAATAPVSIALSANPAYFTATGYNVVGVLPGRTRPDEVIVFSAHYDHEGIRGKRKDSVMNGANDNASGTTAVLALAEYFAKRSDNDRTLMFCAFAGEELGLKGSFAFAKGVIPGKIVALVNIEMIGVPQFGKNKVFITGDGYSSLPDFLSKQLVAAGLKMVGEPGEERALFRRSDNLPFALLGVPAHTIMSSDDLDKCYHQLCDEVDRIDMKHLTAVIRAIAKSVQPLIEGKETPTRIDLRDMR